jgi:methionyl aminopeptidase
VVLPKEPFVWGVSHIAPRIVPPHIKRPPYAQNIKSGEVQSGDVYTGDGRITLGSLEEALLRNSASLAKEVLNFAGKHVKVCL